MFHSEISGKDNNDEHPQKIQLKSVTLLVFHFEISGNDNYDEHPSNIELKLVTLFIPFNFIFNISSLLFTILNSSINSYS